MSISLGIPSAGNHPTTPRTRAGVNPTASGYRRIRREHGGARAGPPRYALPELSLELLLELMLELLERLELLLELLLEPLPPVGCRLNSTTHIPPFLVAPCS